MKYLRSLLVLFFVLLAFITEATHIRAGEVIAKRVSGLTYQFTFVGYRDVEGVSFGQGVFDYGDGNFLGNDPDEQIPWGLIESLGNGVEKWQFTLIYTYSGAANYLVSYKEYFRNENIQNISGSVNTPFYVETLLIIDPLIANSTPFFTVPPIDEGVVGVVFEHNPGAFDPDGDSLSYYFKIPRQDEGLDVNGYRTLNDPAFYTNFAEGNQAKDGNPTLSIDPITGTIVWDSPGGATIPNQENREFNVAFVVEEWRRINGTLVRLGFVTRDMQIIIWNYKNDPPELKVPRDTCIVVDNTITAIITGTDSDGNSVKLEAFGGPFEILPSPTVSPDPGQFQPPPSILNFEWKTDCRLVRALPYSIHFKATDKPTISEIPNPTGQVNFETWRITVVGPPPEGLTAETQPGRKIQLNWNPYSCSNADSIQVWRRVGEFEINPTCNPGIPENSGYQLIATLSVSDIAFLDNNNDLGLSPGSKYCYRLVAVFPLPGGGESIASEEACDSLLVDTPIITNVDIKTTSETDGEIIVKWTPPYQIDTIAFPPTYTYEVLRKEGQGFGGSFTSVRSSSADTIFADTGLNTKDISYSYKIVLYDNTDQPIDKSQQASSVRLNSSPLIGGVWLNWQTNVPWSNNVQKYPYHYIWRDNVINDNPETIQLIDSIDVTINGFSYLDLGGFNGVNLDEETEYCYLVTTFGSYDNDLIPEPLVNKSQIICVQPNDTVPPCIPVSITFNSGISGFDCELQASCQTPSKKGGSGLKNAFSWKFNRDASCDRNDIAFFNIYASQNGQNGDFEFLGQTRLTNFIHNELMTLAHCYYVTAVDRSGNESRISETICNDNCPQYVLPNVFTPNDDSTNETFRPLQSKNLCPRFVDKVLLRVFTRAGVEVYSFDSSKPENTIFINWDGKSEAGKELPSGVYYYSAEVTFLKLNKNNSVEHIKGWVQIIR